MLYAPPHSGGNVNDFYFYNAGALALGGAAHKQQANIEVIRILKQCQAEKRPAIAQEQETLSHYVGWGDSAVLKALHDSAELRAMLSAEEMSAAKGSSLNAHYTDLPVIGAIWDALLHLGLGSLPKLRILDPSAGIGHFKSLTPSALRSKTEWIEIELDSLTAGILGLLHPDSKVYNQGFETVNLPPAWFDLAVSNIPFGNYGVTSKTVPAFAKTSIHDFFFANTVALLRPGGVMAYITSRYTLDKKDSQTRNWLARHTDLLAAVRLPNNAFKANAGTEVITDILILRKREQEQSAIPAWAQVETAWRRIGYASEPLYYSKYYAEHPEMILGKVTFNGTMYRSDGYNVEPDGRDLATAICSALVGKLTANSMLPQEKPEAVESGPAIIITAAKGRSADAEKRLAAMHEIYALAKNLLAAETKGTSLFETSDLRHRLNQAYDRFAAEYGAINKPVNAKLLEGSVEGPFLKALETYDRLSATAQKAGLFAGPLVRSTKKSDAPSVADALLICLDRIGRVDIEMIASSAGVSTLEAVRQLGDLIFQEPGTGKWLTADEYLSGNVREKLKSAQAAVGLDRAFERNVQALTAALPAPLKPSEIRAPLGAGWVPTEMVHGFMLRLLEAGSYNVKYIPALAHWEVDCWDYWRIPNGLMNGRWGTARMSALDLIRDGLNAKIPVVYDLLDTEEGEKPVVNQTETVAAQMKLAEIKTEWETWLWQDTDRAATLAAIYNERYNAHRVRQYDGSHLSAPGLNLAIHPRPQQKNVVWRVLQSPATFVAHEVGMGKTLSGIMAAMEAKRLHLVHKTVVVVPNHLTAQWHAQALWAYPNADILIATAQDLAKGKRGEFLSRIATNDWDLVIVPFSSFKLLPVKPETMTGFFQEQINQLEDYLAELKAEDSFSKATKEIEKAKKRLQAKLDKCADMAKDAVGTITWEELGVDMLIVDEFQAFKNLFFATKMTRIAGLTNSDSQRAFDMFVKVRQTLEKGGKVVGMTGTPVTNTIAEMFTMQRYFQMKTLEDLGLSHFDAWANQFAVAEAGLEMTPDGAGFRMNTRFRKFVNVPELMTLWAQVADTKRIDGGAGIERPNLYGGKPVKVVSDGGDVLTEYVQDLASRAERIHSGMVEPEDDNMLKVAGDGRKAALDMSLVKASLPGSAMPKIDALVDLVAQIFEASTPVNGAQLIFCDLATPKAKS